MDDASRRSYCAPVSYLLLWLRRLIQGVDARADEMWADRPMPDAESVERTSRQMRGKLWQRLSEWADAGDG